MTTPQELPGPHQDAIKPGLWWKVLAAAAGLFGMTVLVTYTTHNLYLVPTMIFVGSFLVPVVVVIFAAAKGCGTLNRDRLAVAFVVGGVLGVLGASVLEAPLKSATISYLLVAINEEVVKAVVIMAVGWSVRPRGPLQGAVLGATVGAGFAAFESAGYAYNASLGHTGTDLLAVLNTELVRAALTPVGHVLWSALVGAALLRATTATLRFPFPVRAVPILIGACGLHALWDSLGPLSAAITARITHGAVPDLAYGELLHSDQLHTALASGLYVGGLALTAVLGYLLLVHELKTAPGPAVVLPHPPVRARRAATT